MIEDKKEVSRDLEKALQALEQAKQRVANEKKKQDELYGFNGFQYRCLQ